MTTYSDNFTRADSTTEIGTTSTGNRSWQPSSGSVWGINTNRAYASTSTGLDCVCTFTAAADADVSVKLDTISTVCGIVVRSSDNDNFIALVPNSGSGSSLVLVKTENGANTALNTFGTTVANGDTIRLVASGTTFTAYKNGVSQGSVSSSFNQAARNVGMIATTASERLDDFSATFTPPSGIDGLFVEFGFGFDPLGWTSASRWTDVTSAVRSISTNRGRSNTTDNYSAGTASIVLNNDDYRFDPDNSSGPYASDLLPSVPVRISTWDSAGTQQYVFQGFVAARSGWEQNYLADGNHAETTVNCVDFISLLGGQTLPITYTTTSFTRRILRLGKDLLTLLIPVVREAPVPSYYGYTTTDLLTTLVFVDIFPTPPQTWTIETDGQTITQGFDGGGDNALQWIQKLADTEGGLFYIGRDGSPTFDGRYTPLTGSRSASSQATFDDSGANVPMSVRGFTKTYASEVFNKAVITPEGMDPQEHSDTTSITRYTQSDYTRDVICDSSAEATARAEAIVLGYKDPTNTPAGAQSPDFRRSDATLDGYLPRELRDRVTVKFQPPGAAAQVTTEVFVERVAHNIGMENRTWDCTLGFGADHTAFWTDTIFTLDTSLLNSGTDLLGF